MARSIMKLTIIVLFLSLIFSSCNAPDICPEGYYKKIDLNGNVLCIKHTSKSIFNELLQTHNKKDFFVGELVNISSFAYEILDKYKIDFNITNDTILSISYSKPFNAKGTWIPDLRDKGEHIATVKISTSKLDISQDIIISIKEKNTSADINISKNPAKTNRSISIQNNKTNIHINYSYLREIGGN